MKYRLNLVTAAAVATLATLAACKRPAAAPAPAQPAPTAAAPTAATAAAPAPQNPAPALQIPRAATAVQLSEHDNDKQWLASVATAPFRHPDSGDEARPYSIARMLWDDEALYLSLYAADQNIAADATPTDASLWLGDAFDVRVQADTPGAPIYVMDVAPNGAISDARLVGGGAPDRSWHSGARVSVDIDGSLNQPEGEDDEEWVAFLAIPWKSLGLSPAPGLKLRARLGRCDTLRDGQRRCGQWGGSVSALAGTVELAK